MNIGDVKVSDGVIFRCVTVDDSFVAYSASDTHQETVVDVYMNRGEGVVVAGWKGGLAVPFPDWAAAAKYLKEIALDEGDRQREQNVVLKAEFDGLPADPSGTGKRVGNIIYETQSGGRIRARSVNDTSAANPMFVDPKEGSLRILNSGERYQSSARSWEEVQTYIANIFTPKDEDLQKHILLAEAFDHLPSP